MKNKKNYYIVRFYLDGKICSALSIMKKDAIQFQEFYEQAHENEAGGITTWFRVDVSPRYKEFIENTIKNAESDENFVVSPTKF
jgi:hypothetical protein